MASNQPREGSYMEESILDNQPIDLVLASTSPRRKQLFEQEKLRFRVLSAHVDETLDADLRARPFDAVQKLAEKKAHAVVNAILADENYRGFLVVVGADTMVARGGEVFGKPTSASDATRMLRALSGTSHYVHTGVSVWYCFAGEHESDFSLAYRSFTDTTRVTFRQLSSLDIETYLATGEPFDKAGAYGIQGSAAQFVQQLDGLRSTVVGFPMERFLHEFADVVQRVKLS